MEQYAFDDSVLLRFLRHVYEPSERVVVVFLAIVLVPLVFRILCNRVGLVLVELLDGASSDGHVDDTHGDGVGQVRHHRPSEIVCWRESRVLSAEWGIGGVPLPFLPVHVGHVHSCHHLETRIHVLPVLCLYGRIPFHIRLTEAEENVEVGIEGVGLLGLATVHHFVDTLHAVLEIADIRVQLRHCPALQRLCGDLLLCVAFNGILEHGIDGLRCHLGCVLPFREQILSFCVSFLVLLIQTLEAESLAEVPNLPCVSVHRPVSSVVVGEKFHHASVRSSAPYFLHSVVPDIRYGLVAAGLLVVGVFVHLGHVLHVAVDVVVVIVEHIISVRVAVDEVDRLLACVPRLLAELNAARRCKSRDLVLHVGHAVVHQHRSHGES